MNEKEMFKQIVANATENPMDKPPTEAQEFDVYCDKNYNIYMLIKGEWTNIGLNVAPL